MAFIVAQQVAGHLHRGIENHPIGNLVRQGRIHPAFRARLAPAAHLLHSCDALIFDVEYPRCVVHRPAENAGIRQKGLVRCGIARAPAVILHTAHAFARHKVGPCAAYARRLDGLMSVYHHMVRCRRLHHLLEVADSRLAVARDSGVQAAAGVTRLYGGNAELLGPGHRALELILEAQVVPAGLVVGNQSHTLLARICRNAFHVKIRRGASKVKIRKGVRAAPCIVPTLEEYAVYVVCCSKIDVPQGLGCGGSVVLVAAPGLYAEVHPPPYAYVLHRAYPADVPDGAGLIQIENERRIHEPDGTACYLHRTPGAYKGPGHHGLEA